MKDAALRPESDTKRNIRRYQEQLPHVRGKVIAAVWMLLLSAAVMVGTSFAWYTLSTAPEVTGISTTIVGNGSLEIALSDSDGLEPDSSAVGDSVSASGQSVIASNLTWGNLVNLSDASYGLDNIVLRPSVLNLFSLLTSPIQAVTYGGDGRVSGYTDSFAYTTYDSTSEEPFVIITEDAFGVRGISFISYESESANQTFANLKSQTYSALAAADYSYNAVVSNEDYINSLAAMMSPYLSQIASEALGYTYSAGDCSPYVEGLYNMTSDLQSAYEQLGEAYVLIAKLQQAQHSSDSSYDDWTLETLLAASESDLSAKNISITNLAEYAADREQLAAYVDKLYGYYVAYRDNGTKVNYDDITDIINYVADIQSATLNGVGLDETSKLMSLVIKEYNNLAVSLNGGLLYRIEERLQSAVAASGVEVTVNAGSYSLSPAVAVSTSAEGMTAWDDYNSALTGISFMGEDPVARDTYAYAIDFWVRTNASGENYLTLDGAVTTDSSGNVIGYEGSDRVWSGEESLVYGSATTQGSGSCYIFTASDPVEANKILELLNALTVAFVDDEGNVLAYAGMDTENVWAESGRYVVPMVVRFNGSNYLAIENDDGTTEDVYYITALTQNEAQRITAIVYLDGTKVENSQATTEDFVGSLNIQFSCTAELTPLDNDDLSEQVISASATASATDVTYSVNGQTVTLTASITADATPTTVTAYFLRQVNSSQGVAQETITFTNTSASSGISLTAAGDGSDGNTTTWVGSATLTTPGTYVLTALTIDGREYTMSQLGGENVTVTVNGYALSAVNGDASGDGVFSMGSSVSTDLSFTLTNGGVLDIFDNVTSVRAVFLSEDGTMVSSELTMDEKTRTTAVCSGSFTFRSSGTYTLTYLYINGEAFGVEEDLQYTLNVTLGVNAQVKISTDAVLEDGETATSFTLPDSGSVALDVAVQISDSAGNLLTADDTGSTATIRYKANTGYVLDATLTYNEETGQYEGSFQVYGAGTYSFQSLTVEGGAVSSISNAPDIVASAPPEPTAYYADSTESAQVILTSSAYLSVGLTNATELTVTATVTDETTGTTYSGISGVLSDSFVGTNGEAVSTYLFELPTGSDGATQDGYWSLASLTFTDFIDTDGTKYTNGATCTWDMEDQQISTKVISTIYVSLTYDGEQETAYSGEFMEDHVADGFVMTLMDYEDEPIPERYVTSTKLVYGWNGASAYRPSGVTVTTFPEEFDMELPWVYSLASSYILSFYSGSQNTVSPAMVSAGEFVGDGVWNFSANFRLAGTYYPGAMVTIDGKEFGISTGLNVGGTYFPNGVVWEMTNEITSETTKLENWTSVADLTAYQESLPLQSTQDTWERVTVTWNSPTVSVTDISPDADTLYQFAYTTNETTSKFLLTHNYTSGTTTYVMDVASKDDAGTVTYTHPKIQLTLTGGGNFDTATLNMSSAGTTTASEDSEIVFTPEGRTIWNEVICTGTGRYVYANTITYAYDGMVCTVKLSSTITVSYTAPPTSSYSSYVVTSAYYDLDKSLMSTDWQEQSDAFYEALKAALPTGLVTKASVNGTSISSLTKGYKYTNITYVAPDDITFEVDGTTYKVTQWYALSCGSGYTSTSKVSAFSAGTSKTINYGYIIYPYNFEVVTE